MANIYGYIRVSTRDQNEDRQLIALQLPAVQATGAEIEKNDLLYIKSIDRLGRNYAEILEQWR